MISSVCLYLKFQSISSLSLILLGFLADAAVLFFVFVEPVPFRFKKGHICFLLPELYMLSDYPD